MNSHVTIGLFTMAPMVLSLAGCALEDATGLEDENTGAQMESILTQNALTQNALTQNALTQNALTQNALTQNALTQNALLSDSLRDPLARDLLRYITSCALPEGESLSVTVDGTAYRFDGQLGLSPAWGREGGSCGTSCQAIVSSCVLSRINYLGVQVDISLRSHLRAALPSPGERQAYSRPEAVYYGNIFATPQTRFACLPPGATSIPRVCGPSTASCVVEVESACDCTSSNHVHGYWGCTFPGQPDRVEPVTIYLQP
jgi:hypothetical protein